MSVMGSCDLVDEFGRSCRPVTGSRSREVDPGLTQECRFSGSIYARSRLMNEAFATDWELVALVRRTYMRCRTGCGKIAPTLLKFSSTKDVPIGSCGKNSRNSGHAVRFNAEIPSVVFGTFIATSSGPETLCPPPQHRLELVRVDTVDLHHGPDNGIGQDLVERWFAMMPIYRRTPHGSAGGVRAPRFERSFRGDADGFQVTVNGLHPLQMESRRTDGLV